LDAAAGFERVRDKYRSAIDALFDRFSRTAAFDPGQDRAVMQDLIDLAPPGVDELAAVIEVVDALEEGGGTDLVVIDTAPSGHALRLLEMPGLVQAWARALMAIMLKYQPVVGVGELGAILLRLSQGLGRLRVLLADPDRTHFVIVTRAAALPHAESIRLLKRLSKLSIHIPTMIVNAVGAGECPRCRRQREHETRDITRLRRALKAAPQQPQLVAAPGWIPPPQGQKALAVWRGSWRVLR
jgi:arsenite-transporting ATPase